MKLPSRQKVKKEIISIALIVFFVFAFRSSFFEPFRIPTGSMIPTIMIGDFILVNKFSYGFRLPYSGINVFGKNFDPIYLFGESGPKRGDVIVFKYPKNPSIDYIKRVIGLPGDTIEMRDRIIYVNDTPIEYRSINGDEIMKDMDDQYKDKFFEFIEAKTGSNYHKVIHNKDSFLRVDFHKVIIPEDHYFVMGDNRDFSSDSRSWGFVPKNFIKGKAILVWFSMILPGSVNSFKLRLRRIGTLIN